jgi:p-aminobenzoyl-glutamate transporter AbgT
MTNPSDATGGPPEMVSPPNQPPPRTRGQRLLDAIEWAGNKLPDPAMLFVIALLITWVLSAALANVEFQQNDPRTGQKTATGEAKPPEPIRVKNQLSGTALTTFLSKMVKTFVEFPPLGIVLVALLGVGVAEHTGFINAFIKALMSITPQRLLTPMLVLVAIISHTAGDTGYVLVIPLGGMIFYASGRHPLAGILAAFAGVSGGFSANFIPSSLDTVLQGFTQSAGQLIDPGLTVNPLCNWGFMSLSCVVIVSVAWYITDRVVEPRLRANTVVDGDPADMPVIEPLKPAEQKGLYWAMGAMLLGVLLLVAACFPADSPFRAPPGSFSPEEWRRFAPSALGETKEPAAADEAFARFDKSKDQKVTYGEVAAFDQSAADKLFETTSKPKHRSLVIQGAPLMDAIVPLIFLLFLLPGVVYGYAAGTVQSHRDIVKGMSKSMSTMGYYLVLAFFAAQFIYAFNASNLGALVAIYGAAGLKSLGLPNQVTILGIILLTTLVNLLIGSASAKWALLGPIFVPMLMGLNISPELTQAAYRVGDSCTNIITPLMPYFPLVLVYCQRYVKNTGTGTLVAQMLPYSLSFLVTWTVLLLIYWGIGLPLGLQASYTYGVSP